MARYKNLMVEVSGVDVGEIKKEEKSNKNLILGVVILSAIGAGIWWKMSEDKKEKDALRRIEGKGDLELYKLLEEEERLSKT